MLCLPVAEKNNRGIGRINQVIFFVSEQNKTIKQNLYYSELNKPSKTNVHLQVEEHNGRRTGIDSVLYCYFFLPKSSLLHLDPPLSRQKNISGFNTGFEALVVL